MYEHDFEHIDADGVKTSFSYVAHKVKHLVHLSDREVGFLNAKCRNGELVEITVSNSSAPSLWSPASSETNATILVGNARINCKDDDDEEVSILHRVIARATLELSNDDFSRVGHVFRIRAESTHFSHAFEHLHLKYYRGTGDIAAAKEELKVAAHENGAERDTDPDDSSDSIKSPPHFYAEKSDPAESSTANADEVNFDFLTLLHDGNVSAAAEAAGKRRLLSATTYSCNHDGACALGQYQSGWEYGDTCCCENWGTCNSRLCGTEYRPTCPYCSQNKACATCSSCLLCAESHSCDSCEYGSNRPYRVSKIAGYECEACRYASDCPVDYVCNGWPNRMTCEPGNALTCSGTMPVRSDRTQNGNKYVVILQSVTVEMHDSSENVGEHEYYAATKISGLSWSDNIYLPCLTHQPLNEILSVSAEIAEVSCGDSFRFGIWEDDVIFDDAMGDRWFTTLDFLASPIVTFAAESAKVTFRLECQGCHEYCREENSLLTALPALSNPSYSSDFSSVVDPYLPLGIWNYNEDTRRAANEYKLETDGMIVSCQDCHLAISGADLYIEVTLDAFSGFRDFAILANSEATFHINALFEGSGDDRQTWRRQLLQPFGLPYPLFIGGTINLADIATIGFQIGLKASVDLTAELSTSVIGTAEYTSDVIGTLKTGLVYNVDKGSRFLGASLISNERITWSNSINGALSAKVGVRPCIQGGIWGGTGFADAHAYAEICADVFTQSTLSHASGGFDSSPGSDSDISRAAVHLDELLPNTFKTCDVSIAPHDTRLLVTVGVGNPILSADMHAALWVDTSSLNTPDADETQLRETAYGPWELPALGLSVPVASGCLCVSACDDNSAPTDPSTIPDDVSSPDDVSPVNEALSPTSTAVNMPNAGIFVTGTLSLTGLSLYEWTSAAELAFRKAIAESAQVSVSYVRVDVSAEHRVSRRRLLETSLDVTYFVFSSSANQAELVARRITVEIQSGNFIALTRYHGLTRVTSVNIIMEAYVATISSFAHVLGPSILFGMICVFMLFI